MRVIFISKYTRATLQGNHLTPGINLSSTIIADVFSRDSYYSILDKSEVLQAGLNSIYRDCFPSHENNLVNMPEKFREYFVDVPLTVSCALGSDCLFICEDDEGASVSAFDPNLLECVLEAVGRYRSFETLNPEYSNIWKSFCK